MPTQRVGVVGAGTMGNGIAHVFARSAYDVVLCDVEQRFLDRGLDTIARNLDREVAKNKITAADKDAALGRITPVFDRAKLANCDFVVEAATEKFEIKSDRRRAVFFEGIECAADRFAVALELRLVVFTVGRRRVDSPAAVLSRRVGCLLPAARRREHADRKRDAEQREHARGENRFGGQFFRFHFSFLSGSISAD